MKLTYPNDDIEKETNLTLFIQKYLGAYNPSTEDERQGRCGNTKRRSFSDLRELYLNYNPTKEVSLEDIIRCLPNVVFERETTSINLRYCSTPQKVVVFASDSSRIHSSWGTIAKKIYSWGEDCYKKGEDGLSEEYVVELIKSVKLV